ncbi:MULTISPECIES: hypothetical protein [unclassified Streptomyces]|uniref:hypothetical protein n=1 Tax=unclassified Streptomyces TaxID=2593676 RepID=UPI00036D790A|nr:MULTISPECIES: hypothetical protein [unclassified Streptomyces]MYQ78018.1 hypothetical protein [Streptomyces sp. SID4923]NEC07422.1 hypothetical protein [Streptomyces sp. SID7909]
MSQPVPPPNQPYGQPQGGNPFAGGQQQPGAPFGGGPAPFTPAPPARKNIALGLGAGVVAAVVGALVYGLILGNTDYQIGYIAVGLGFLVGFAASKLGGANPAVTVVSALLSIGAVYIGQLVGVSIALSDLAHESASSIFFDHFGALTDAYSEGAGFKDYLFLVLGAVGAVAGARKAA